MRPATAPDNSERRFKSVILERINALSACVTYVELNPVRAGLKNSPSDYNFTTWDAIAEAANTCFTRILSNT